MSDENKTLTPVWICYVDGKRLDTKHEGALKKIVVKDTLNGVGLCSLLFDTSAEKLLDLGTFSLESEISVHLGYKDDVEEVFNGEITEFAPQFKEFGHEMVEVVCCNAMYKFLHGKHFTSIENKNCSETIQDIISKYSLSAEVDSFGATYAFDNIHDMTDYDFIEYCCNRYGKDFYAYADKVYIKDNIEVRSDEVIFEWGKSLIEFYPSMRIKNVYSECNCVGWDSQKCEGITANAKIADIPVKIGGSNDWTKVSKGGSGTWVHNIVDEIFFDEEDAKNVALGSLQKNSFNFMTATGKAEGTYKLLPGMRVNIKYVGKTFEGEYIAESVTHSFDNVSGYTTSFSLKRNMCS